MKRKGFLAEGDLTLLLKRYDASTILSLLYEISKSASASRVNWEEIVKESNTGIKNAREYQALWRHLAYRKDLDADGEELPLEEDESDLEFELDPFPSVTSEAAAEASSYADALMGFSSDIAFANAESTALGLTSIFPGFASSHSSSFEYYRANPADRRKRKPWTAQEDEELAAGVEKYGEGNWTSIYKYFFKHDRTASQLAQRWALIKKRRETTVAQPVAAPAKPLQGQGQGQGQQYEQCSKKPKVLTEHCEQNGVPALPVQPAVSPAACLPKQQVQPTQARASFTVHKKPAAPVVPRTSIPNATPAKAKPVTPANANAQKLPVAATNQQASTPAASPGSKQTRTNSLPSRAPLGPDPMVQAAAVAAGARIAPASAAASFMKAKNVVHVRPPVMLNNSPKPSNNAPARSSPVVHYIRTGSGAPPPFPSLNGKRPAKSALAKNANTAVNRLNLKAGSSSNTMSRLAVNSSSRDEAPEPSNKKRKIIVARENNGTLNSHVSSWYEVLEETTGADGKSLSPSTVVDVDSDTDEAAVGTGGMVCTSSNESFSQSAFGGAMTPNGASPLSQSSGGQSE